MDKFTKIKFIYLMFDKKVKILSKNPIKCHEKQKTKQYVFTKIKKYANIKILNYILILKFK